MSLQANDLVGRRHHHVQVMQNEKNAAIQPVSNALYQAVKRYLAIEVDALHRLVENKKIWRVPINRVGNCLVLQLRRRQNGMCFGEKRCRTRLPTFPSG